MTAEEKAAYQRGYQAGRKRVDIELKEWQAVHASITHVRSQRIDAFYCAALHFALTCEGWSHNGVPIKDYENRLDFAKRIALSSYRKLERP
jgi:hypothetical protein